MLADIRWPTLDTYNFLLEAKATVSMEATECKQKIAAAYKACKPY